MFEYFLINCGQAWPKHGDCGEIWETATLAGAGLRKFPPVIYSAGCAAGCGSTSGFSSP